VVAHWLRSESEHSSKLTTAKNADGGAGKDWLRHRHNGSLRRAFDP